MLIGQPFSNPPNMPHLGPFDYQEKFKCSYNIVLIQGAFGQSSDVVLLDHQPPTEDSPRQCLAVEISMWPPQPINRRFVGRGPVFKDARKLNEAGRPP
jgi:hypothetical protein